MAPAALMNENAKSDLDGAPPCPVWPGRPIQNLCVPWLACLPAGGIGSQHLRNSKQVLFQQQRGLLGIARRAKDAFQA